MPQCCKCSRYLPPDFIDNEIFGKVCHFCKEQKDYLLGSDGTIYRKDEVIYDYYKLTKKLANSNDLKDKMNKIIVDKAVEKLNNETKTN